jgi:Ca2+-binding EF-hand superfamily protein
MNERVVSFKLYDMDNDGYIDKNELFQMLRASLFENFMLELSEAQMKKLVDSTFDEVDTNGDGKISFGTNSLHTHKTILCIVRNNNQKKQMQQNEEKKEKKKH